MNHQPFTENEVLDRLWFYANNGVRADATPVANACRWLTRGPDDEMVTAHWPDLLREFTRLFHAAYPTGLLISVPPSATPRLDQASRQCPQANPNLPLGMPPIPAPYVPPRPPRDLRRYEPSLVEALRLWEKAKAAVLGIPADPAYNPIASPPPCGPPPVPRPTQSLVVPAPAPPQIPRRLLGGSAGEPAEEYDDPGIATGSSLVASRLSPTEPQLAVAQPDLFSEAAQLQPTPPKTTVAPNQGMPNHRVVSHGQPVATSSPQALIFEAARPGNAPREITVRPAKPTASADPVTNTNTPRARWTAEELQSARREADGIAQVINGCCPEPGLLDANTRDALLSSWAGGTTRAEFALALLAGRERELKVIQNGINRTANGGSYFQLLTGLNGVGKSFLLEAVVSLAIKDGLAVAQLEFKPQDRLCDNEGATRGLLSKLINGLKFDGASQQPGLVQLLDQLCADALKGTTPSTKEARKLIEAHCRSLLFQPGGEDVVKVLSYYAQHAGDLGRQVKAIQWFRAEYDSVSEAKKELGVSSIVGDGDFLRHLTTIATLCRFAGKHGLLVICDELSVLVRSLHKAVRQANYDTILNAFNASADGRSHGLGFVFAGTPDCLDPRQGGLLSHAALASRLQGASNPKGIFSSGPILELKPLRPVELFVALQKARGLVLGPDGASRLPDVALEHLIDACLRPLGAQEFLPPRKVLMSFASVVQTLEADPSITWQAALGVAEGATTRTAGDPSPQVHAAFQNLKL